jgi:DNA-binding Xre family transcriptional regulator
MNAKDLLKQLMAEKGVSNADMANRIGISQASVWDRLNNKKNKSLSISTLNSMLKAMDYEIVVVPRGKKIGIKVEE